jgi:NTE family protein
MDVTPGVIAHSPRQRWRPENCDRIALVLQGGGALGAYQAGVYEALHEAGIEPDWIDGVSIGAINGALIAGNPPERRLERLREFWELVTSRHLPDIFPHADEPRRLRNLLQSCMTLLLGQPGFFTPNVPNPWLSLRGAKTATAFYDSTPLLHTLRELVDFDLINNDTVRFAVGAVNVATGNFIYFDNAKQTILPQHIMASAALPPGLPMVRIGSDYYWDGGLVSNTPLSHLMEEAVTGNMLVFQVDLFSARGEVPRDMSDVLAREKEIRYSSRTRLVTDQFRVLHSSKVVLRNVLNKVPDEKLSQQERELKEKLKALPRISLLHLIYRKAVYEDQALDYEFSTVSMKEHWERGYQDTKNTLTQKDWLTIPSEEVGLVVHDVHQLAEMC